MWFNHIIKIEDSRMIAAEHLWSFITRGAMIMCTDNQAWSRHCLACLCQGRIPWSRDCDRSPDTGQEFEHYGHNIDKTLFDAMDPFKIGLFVVLTMASKAYHTDGFCTRLG
jgi:hypothetical protein